MELKTQRYKRDSNKLLGSTGVNISSMNHKSLNRNAILLEPSHASSASHHNESLTSMLTINSNSTSTAAEFAVKKLLNI